MRIDFHTHSIASPDGGLSEQDYAWLLDNKLLDYIAITDHNTIEYAVELARVFPNNVIVGEEVMTSDGEIIGLFLNHLIPEGLTALQTVEMIKKRGGLVYVPHPLETVRHGLTTQTLDSIATFIDIIEVRNGRAMQSTHSKITAWLKDHPHILPAAGSDAHSKSGARYTFTKLTGNPSVLSANNLKKYLKNAELIYNRPPLRAFLAPKMNRLKKRINL